MAITPLRRVLLSAAAATAGLLVLGSVSTAAASRSTTRAVTTTPVTFTVDTTADPDTGASCSAPGSGLCSLRDALAAASLAPSGGVVTFSVAGPFKLRAPLAVSQGTVTVQGNPDGSTVIQAGPSGRIITAGGATLSPGIVGQTDLTLEHVVLTGGHAAESGTFLDAFGGAVFAGLGATLNIADSHLHDNSADCAGGAVAAFAFSPLQGFAASAVTITRTTMDHNAAGAACPLTGTPAGGLFASGGAFWTLGTGAATITNSTIAANSALYEGSAITDLGGLLGTGATAPLSLTGDTVAANTATNVLTLPAAPGPSAKGAAILSLLPGAGVSQMSRSALATAPEAALALTRALGLPRSRSMTGTPTGVLTLTNTLLDNPGGSCHALAGTPVDGTGNFATDTSCNLSSTSVVPSLKVESSLHDNGGFAPTLGLLTGSPALGGGTNAACTATSGSAALDERGVPRPQGARCDSGAVEPAATTSSLSAPTTVMAGVPFSLTATVSTVSPLAFGPTGTATVSEGSTTVGTLTLIGRAAHMAARSAALTLSDTLAPGTHVLTLSYAGTPGFLPSTGRLQIVVAPPAMPIPSPVLTAPTPAGAVAAISAVPTTGAGGLTPSGPLLLLAGISTLGLLVVRRRR